MEIPPEKYAELLAASKFDFQLKDEAAADTEKERIEREKHLIWKFDVAKLEEILPGSANSEDMDYVFKNDENETIRIAFSCFEQSLLQIHVEIVGLGRGGTCSGRSLQLR